MKQKRQIGILFVLVLMAAVVWLWSFRDKPGTVDAGPNVKGDEISRVNNPVIRTDLIEHAVKAEYKSSGRNIFSYAAGDPTTSRPRSADQQPVIPKMPCGIDSGPCPPLPPEPPKLPPNVKFFGFGTVPNGTSRRAFLTNGDEVVVLSEGEVFLNRYRVLRIGNASLEFEDISTGLPGKAPLEEQSGGTP